MKGRLLQGITDQTVSRSLVLSEAAAGCLWEGLDTLPAPGDLGKAMLREGEAIDPAEPNYVLGLKKKKKQPKSW